MEICNTAPMVAEHGFTGPVKVMDKNVAGAAKTTEQELPAGDKVSVSRDGLLLTEAMRAAQIAPDIRAARVDNIKARIADGTYQIDAARIAAALVREDPGIFSV